MRRLVVAFLAIVLVAGALLAPAYAQSPQVCWGENKRVCVGESQSGDAYLMLKNSSDIGFYIWMNPQITAVPSSSSIRSKHLWALGLIWHRAYYSLAA